MSVAGSAPAARTEHIRSATKRRFPRRVLIGMDIELLGKSATSGRPLRLSNSASVKAVGSYVDGGSSARRWVEHYNDNRCGSPFQSRRPLLLGRGGRSRPWRNARNRKCAFLFEPLADDMESAISASRSERMDRALKDVYRGVSRAVHAHLKRLVGSFPQLSHLAMTAFHDWGIANL